MTSASPEAMLHLAHLHVLSLAGFASTSQAASMHLSAVTERYFRLIATSCMERAAHAGRSKVAAADVVSALDDLGYGLDELADWMGEEERNARFDHGGMDELEGYLREGRPLDHAIAELHLIPKEELEDEDTSGGEDEEAADGDDSMDVDADEAQSAVVPDVKPVISPISFDPAPDPVTWLPPLPGSEPESKPNTDITAASIPVVAAAAAAAAPAAGTASTAPLSLMERYRRPIPYASSTLATRNFVDPTAPATPFPIKPKTSSLPALLEAYKAIASEPSVSLRQTDIRRQAVELLRKVICPPDQFFPSDTLSAPPTAFAPPRRSPVYPSYNITHPEKNVNPVQVNDNPTGMLAQLVRTIQSPHLPPTLRQRLTTVRPPQPLMRDGEPVLYGDPVRGPDKAALDKVKGRPVDPADEEYHRATWDAGPKGMKRWSRAELPEGDRVIASGIGEDVPRQPGGRQTSTAARSSGSGSGDGGAPTPGVRLRLRGDLSPGTPAAGMANTANGAASSSSSFSAEANARPRISLSPTKMSSTSRSPVPQPPTPAAAATSASTTNTAPHVNASAEAKPKIKIRFGRSAADEAGNPASGPAPSPSLEVPKPVKLRLTSPGERK